MTVKITSKKKEGLKELGLETTDQILSYFPYRYEILDYIDEAHWSVDNKVVFEGFIVSKPKMSRFGGNKNVIYFEVETDYNTYRVSVFNRQWLFSQLTLGRKCTIIGKYEGSNKVLANQINFIDLASQLGIKPIYSLKDKVPEKYFLKLIDDLLKDSDTVIENIIPDSYRLKYGYVTKKEAIKSMHQPKSMNELKKAMQLLKYEEFFKFNLIMQQRKKSNIIIDEGFKKVINVNKIADFVKGLPFTLTDDQKKAVREILADLASDHQMFRLLQGDVGCGKTAVAFIAMYALASIGKQAVMMAPTEILAKQHYKNLCSFFKGYDVGVGLLCASMTSSERQKVLDGLENGSIHMVVGTHSLFQDTVFYHDLGLIITDEQHRFGVKQRQALLLKGNHADVLMMSATPIPRTLATSLYGDMDVSTITETPNKGKVIHTTLIEQNSFTPKLDEIEKLLAQGNQMYVVCSTIEESTTGARNVVTIYENLKKYFAGRYSVGLLHGQMDELQKNEIEKAFAQGDIDILVATTVIEVGVDVKNANIMIIYDANRFGLSQLHQLRGRVGRGEKEGYCYLLTSSNEAEAIQKLKIIEQNTDGFVISNYDLQLRGPGDIFGYRQSGLPEFILANVIEDTEILYQALDDAKEILENISLYPDIEKYIKENSDETRIIA